MKMLLCFDYFRGPDSTGFASISKTVNTGVISKIASHPFDLFGTTAFKAALSGHKSSVFLGHNRAATRGIVTGYNAHPFECGDIIGAHNGTLTPGSLKELEEALDEEFDVDSHAIFAAIDKFGIKETTKMLQGAWALVWYDFKDDTINFLRNEERPFWLAYSEKCDKIFWASEYPMIQAACKMVKNGQDLYVDKENHSFWGTEVNKHYKFELPVVQAGGVRPPKPTVAIIKGKEPVKVAKPAGGVGGPFLLGHNSAHTSSTTKTGNKTTSTTNFRGTKTEPSNESTVLTLQGTSDNPFAGYYSELEMQLIADEGCTFCGEDIDIEKGGVTIFEEENIVLCPKCTSHQGKDSRIYTSEIING